MNAPTPLIDIRPDHWKIVRNILHKHVPQYEVWAFGSRATWKAKEFSDLDLAIITDQPLSLDVSASLNDDFSESDLPWKVDVVDWATTSEAFRKIMERDKVVIQERKRSLGMGTTKAPISHKPSWTVFTLAEITIKIGSGATPKGGAESYLPNRTNFALVRSQNVFDRYFDHAGLAFISDEQAHGLRGVVLQPNDILLNITGDGITFGRACKVPNDVLPACVNQHVSIIRIDPKRANPGYVLSFLTHPDVKAYIESFNAGGSRRAITIGHIEAFRLPLPPFEEQRTIAHILGTLDDKIELNRQQNETLEAMARALFKAWFVDFEPVRAKMEGRWQRGQSLPGLPAHLYDLFPDRFVESELGEIPEGWRHSTIGEEVTVCGGSTPSTKEPEFWEGGQHCWATPKDLSALKFPVLLDTDRKITDAGLARISSGLLPVGTVLLSSRAPIGYLAIAEVPTAINQGFIAMKCDGALPNVFVLPWCRESMDAIVGNANANGSTFQEISKSNFRPIRVVVPSDPVLTSFTGSAVSLYRQLAENERESRSLAQLRDTLLPKLISGELRIPHAEAFLKERGL